MNSTAVDPEGLRRLAELLQSCDPAQFEQGQELLHVSGLRVSDLREVWGTAPIAPYLTDQEIRVWVYLHMERHLPREQFQNPQRDYENFFQSLHCWAYRGLLDHGNLPAGEWGLPDFLKDSSGWNTAHSQALAGSLGEGEHHDLRRLASIFADPDIAWGILQDPSLAFTEALQHQHHQLRDLCLKAPSDEAALAYADALSVLAQHRKHFWGQEVLYGLPRRVWSGDRHQLLVDLKRELRV